MDRRRSSGPDLEDEFTICLISCSEYGTAGVESVVSIVLPTKNGARYLREAVESVLAQTYRSWELILVDDGSSDDTPRIIDEYADRDNRIHAMHPVQTGRLPGALNSGFGSASGEYLTWTSDDNLYKQDALEKLVEYLDANSEVDLVFSDYTVIDEDGSAIESVHAENPAKLVHYNVVGPCFLYRRSLAERIGRYDESMFCAEDYDWWLRAMSVGRLAPLDLDLYFYRIHSQSLTATKNSEVENQTLESLAKNIGSVKGVSKADLSLAYLKLARWRFDCGDVRGLRKFLMKCLLRQFAQIIRQDRVLLLSALTGQRFANRVARGYLSKVKPALNGKRKAE